jgi:hypothetical protein
MRRVREAVITTTAVSMGFALAACGSPPVKAAAVVAAGSTGTGAATATAPVSVTASVTVSATATAPATVGASAPAQAKAEATATAKGVAQATASQGAAEVSAAGADATSPGSSPQGSQCPDVPGTETVLVDGTTTVDGAFTLLGYVQTALCGPGVPDDVDYQNTGSHRGFALPADVKVELTGTTSLEPRAATLADLEGLLQITSDTSNATYDGFRLPSHYFVLTLGAGGRIVQVTSLYRP